MAAFQFEFHTGIAISGRASASASLYTPHVLTLDQNTTPKPQNPRTSRINDVNDLSVLEGSA